MHASRADPVAARCRPGVDSHVAYYDFPASIPQVLDILFVIDHTTAMAPYQTEIDGLPAGVEAALLDPTGAQADLRIAVTTVDAAGAFRQPSATTDGFLALGYDGHLARAANYTGSLADALAPLIDVGASAAITSQPLAAAKAALDAHPTFLRSTAALGIVTITASDDASTGTVDNYVTALKARKTDPLDVALSSFYPKPATRLDAFHVAFPNRATSVEIATADLSQPLGLLTSLLKTVLGYGCPLEPADVDAVTAGAQYDCDLDAYYDDGTTEPVRQCQTNMTGPCFLFTADPANCPDPRSARVSLRGFPTRWTPAVRGQCVVIGQN